MRLIARFYHLMLVNLSFALANSSDMFLLNRAQELGLPIWLVPIVWSVFSFLKSLASLVTGRIVDQMGSKRVLMVGLLTYAGAYLLMGNTLSLGNFLVSMMIYGLICAGIEPAHRAIIAGSAVPERRGSAFGIAHLIIASPPSRRVSSSACSLTDMVLTPASPSRPALQDWRRSSLPVGDQARPFRKI